MNRKEFFKPTKLKIILTLILFVLIVLIAFSGRGCACMGPYPGESCVGFCIPGPHVIYVVAMLFLLIFGLPVAIFSSIIYSFVNAPFHPANISGSLIALLVFLTALLWNYLIACIFAHYIHKTSFIPETKKQKT